MSCFVACALRSAAVRKLLLFDPLGAPPLVSGVLVGLLDFFETGPSSSSSSVNKDVREDRTEARDAERDVGSSSSESATMKSSSSSDFAERAIGDS